jgi:beta-glucuronidase
VVKEGKAQPIDTWRELQTAQHHRDVINDLIVRDKNHPCVVMWSVANEPASEEEGAYEYFKPLVELAKEKDPQKRPVTIVTYGGSRPDTCKVADLIDVLCLNGYYGWYGAYGNFELAKTLLRKELGGWGKRCQNKPIMFSEYGANTIP